MNGQSDVQQRLDALEKQIAEIMKRLGSGGEVPEHHRATAGEIEEKRAAIRERIAAEGALHKEPTKGEIERDLESLRNAFERWVKHLDQDFK